MFHIVVTQNQIINYLKLDILKYDDSNGNQVRCIQINGQNDVKYELQFDTTEPKTLTQNISYRLSSILSCVTDLGLRTPLQQSPSTQLKCFLSKLVFKMYIEHLHTFGNFGKFL